MVGREISPVEVEEPPGNTSANQLSADMGAVLSPARSFCPVLFFLRFFMFVHVSTHTHTHFIMVMVMVLNSACTGPLPRYL